MSGSHGVDKHPQTYPARRSYVRDEKRKGCGSKKKKEKEDIGRRSSSGSLLLRYVVEGVRNAMHHRLLVAGLDILLLEAAYPLEVERLETIRLALLVRREVF